MFTNVRRLTRSARPSEVVQTLADAMAAHYGESSAHLAATSDLSARIAARMSLDDSTIANCRTAGLLHDVGMLGIDASILGNPSMLHDADFDLVAEHAALGEDILMSIPALAHLAPIVRAHHERIDGSGYPDGLVGREIPIEARVIAVADAYNVMTAGAPYRAPARFSNTAAMAELFGNGGSQFDLPIVRACQIAVAARSAERARVSPSRRSHRRRRFC